MHYSRTAVVKRYALNAFFVFLMALHYILKLVGASKPPVWRKIIMGDEATYNDLHYAIQAAFGWQDCHLWEFRSVRGTFDCWRITKKDDFGWDFGDESDATPDVPLVENGRLYTLFVYRYDFGDGWEVDVKLDGWDPEGDGFGECVAKKGANPPEDCGGIYGYRHFKDIFTRAADGTLSEEDEAELKSMREWLCLDSDETWDPEVGICLKSEVDACRKAWKKQAAAYTARVKALKERGKKKRESTP